jgi:DNA-binding XRE family transcriptional regulator/tetratricopeptide (TPR) repeat protein
VTDAAEIAQAWRELGIRLASLRRNVGYSQGQLADLVHYTRSSIANIETGRQRAPADFWIRCDKILATAPTLADSFREVERRTRSWRAAARLARSGPVAHDAPSDTTDPAAIDGGAAGEPESPAEIEYRRWWLAANGVDEERLTHLERETRALIADYERIGPAAILPKALMLRRHVQAMLRERQHPPQRHRLYVLGAHLSGLLAVLALDTTRTPSARMYAAEAYDLAAATEDPQLSAWTRANQSLVEYYDGRYLDAVAFARAGQRIAPSGVHAARLAANGEARALARMGDRQGTDLAVGRALELSSTSPTGTPVSESLSLDSYCTARVAANAATAYLSLGLPERALPFARQALPAFDLAQLHGPRALTRLDLATAYAMSGDTEMQQATDLVGQALTITAATPFASVARRAGEFVRMARPRAPRRCVDELAGRLHTYLPSTAGSSTTGR